MVENLRVPAARRSHDPLSARIAGVSPAATRQWHSHGVVTEQHTHRCRADVCATGARLAARCRRTAGSGYHLPSIIPQRAQDVTNEFH